MTENQFSHKKDDSEILDDKQRFQISRDSKYFEDHEDTYANGTPIQYYFNNHEDFCNIVTKLNEIDNTSKGKTDFIIYQHDIIKDLKKENQGLKLEIQYIHTTITDSIKTERTELGKAVLKALKKRIQYETKK